MISSKQEYQSVFESTISTIKENKKNKDTGKVNSIPFGLPRLEAQVPGLMKGVYYFITASSGIGKSQFARYIGIMQPYRFVKSHPETKMKLKIFYFALEETKEQLMLQLISARLKEVYNLSISPLKLMSLGKYTVSDELFKQIESCRDYFKDLEECLYIDDSTSNPTGIFFQVRQYADANGTHYYRNLKNKLDIISKKQYKALNEPLRAKYCYSHYVPNDPDEFVIIMTDHLSLLSTEKTDDANTQHKAMGKFSATYCRKIITKHYNYCVINVIQQGAEKEKEEFTYAGMSIESKLFPSLSGFANNKEVARDAMVVFGLFAPSRYEIRSHLGYDITKLMDNYRCVGLLKNRFGNPNLKLPVYFDGETNRFRELPEPKSKKISDLYQKIMEKRKKK